MLKLDVSSMNSHAKELKKLIDKYEENSMNILLELQNAELDWHDDNSETFFEKTRKQKIQVIDFISMLSKIYDKYINIVEDVLKIDGKINLIYFNSKKRSSVISKYNSSISNIKNFKNRLRGLSVSFCTSYEKNIISSEVSRLNQIISDLTASRDKVDAMFGDLSSLEKNILDCMESIKTVKVNELDV